jgi:hypothetical protein
MDTHKHINPGLMDPHIEPTLRQRVALQARALRASLHPKQAAECLSGPTENAASINDNA